MALAGLAVEVYFTSTNTTPSGGNEIDGINDVTYGPNREKLEVSDFKDGDAAKRYILGLADGEIQVKGDAELTDSVQTLLRTSHTSGASVWAHIYFNPTGSAGSKGFKVECKVPSWDMAAARDAKVTGGFTLCFTGLPVADNG